MIPDWNHLFFEKHLPSGLKNLDNPGYIEKFNAPFEIHRHRARRTTMNNFAQSLSLVFRIPLRPNCGETVWSDDCIGVGRR